MGTFRPQSTFEQLAAHLRGNLLNGKMSGLMPGVLQLEKELGVNRKTVEAALRQLEKEKLLVPQGPGRRRKISLPDKLTNPTLRVFILTMDASERGLPYMLDLQHALEMEGHTVLFAPKCPLDLGMDLRRIARMVEGCEADAWVVGAASQDVLEWFAARETPALALFGRRRNVRIASVGPDKSPVFAAVTRKLISLGHRRIVLLTRRLRRLPLPGACEQAFLDELAAHKITPGSYNLPDWEESVDGFYKRLESLFRVTAPTALIIDEVPFFVATQQFLTGRSIRVPHDVSLVCTDASPDFDWCRPTVAHIRWDSRPVVRRIVRWAANMAQGKEDLRRVSTSAEFVSGGTIGPAKAGK